jgi:fructokinase
MTDMLSAGIELGGTKGVALIARGRNIIARHRVPTTTPSETLGALSAWLKGRFPETPFEALGIASFGPLGLNPARADYGFITQTTKRHWSNADVLGAFRAWFSGPIGFDTDVNGAALAEARWGAAQGTSAHVYLTIGTGVGGGLVVTGAPVHGLVHPEMGHVRVRRAMGDSFAGICPFHGDCLEGLVSGPALAARTGIKGEEILPDNPVWRSVAQEIAELLVSLIMIASPERILIGGGVGMGQPFLFPLIRDAVAVRLQGYVAGLDRAALDTLIVQPGLGEDAGPLGAIALGLRTLPA